MSFQEFIYHGAGFIFLLLASVFLLLDANDNSGRNSQNHFVIASVSILFFEGNKFDCSKILILVCLDSGIDSGSFLPAKFNLGL